MAECSVPDCGKSVFGRGWCGTHYRRWYDKGDVRADEPIQRRGTPPPPCSVMDCGRPAKALGWCGMHYQRWRQHGDPLHEQSHTGENGHNWRGDALASYGSMHARLKVVVGRAKDFVCVDCGRQADDWSYIGGCCPEERTNEKGRPWCTHFACYTTRCRSCHGVFDARRNRAG